MIQGGDPNSKDPAKENRYGEGGPGYKIKAEFNDHPHERGVISNGARARSGLGPVHNFSSVWRRCRGSITNTRPSVN